MSPTGGILGKPDKPKRKPGKIGKAATYTPGKSVDPRKKPDGPKDTKGNVYSEHSTPPSGAGSYISKTASGVENAVVAAASRYLKQSGKAKKPKKYTGKGE